MYFADWTGTENGETSAIVRPRIYATRDFIRLAFLDETNGRVDPYCLGSPKAKLWTQSIVSNLSCIAKRKNYRFMRCSLERMVRSFAGVIAMATSAWKRLPVESDFRRFSMTDFTSRFLSRLPPIGRPVLDKTGLEGRYDFNLALASAPGAGADGIKRSAFEEGFSLFAYALDQIGLRLEAQRALVEMLVVDHVEKTPTEN